ncbi:MAG: hypothetical protein V3T17_16315 [Pseudomonadales bacterium]
MQLDTDSAVAKTLDASDIAARIPHGNSMSLLDRVNAWDKEQIVCSTRSHLRNDNPLKEDSLLTSVSLVEYGAQAAAIHASLLQNSMDDTGPAYLGAIKALKLLSEIVPQTDDDLTIEARAEFHNSSGAIYYFTASIMKTVLAKGKLVLVQPSQP